MSSSNRSADSIGAEYRMRYENILQPLAAALQIHIADFLKNEPRIDRVSARAKDVKSFLAKAGKSENGIPKYFNPLVQIQDQIGCRIIVFYLKDIERIDLLINKYFSAIEQKSRIPESEWEFGYFGRHYVLLLPEDIIAENVDRDRCPLFFELQVKTLFQHAWSEAEHDVGYKPGESPLTPEQKRRLAFASAQAWGADQIFDQLYSERVVGLPVE